MTLGSLFDGSGGFPLAGMINGIQPVWASEVEAYPIRVTSARFPCMKHLGDVTKINGAEIEPVDIITFGSPCQDLSVAGAQKGIHEGTRSSLFFEAVRIIREMRHHDRDSGRTDKHIRPRFAVWENVPGAFSSNKGRDFQAVLQALCEVAEPDVSVPFPEGGKWSKAGCIVGEGYSVAWRTYDAQYWGVPQRRKRIYLIADFAGERAGEILFEQDGMRRNSAQSGEAWEGTPEDAKGSSGRGCVDNVKCLNPWDTQTIRQYDANGVYPALSANTGGGGRRDGVCAPTAAFMGGQGANAGSIAYDETVSPALRATNSGSNQVPDVVCALDCRNMRGYEEISGTLQAKNEGGFSLNFVNPIIHENFGFGKWREGFGTVKACGGDAGGGSEMLCVESVYPEVTGALCANSHPGSYTGQDAFNDMLPVYQYERRYIVRRLTPLECCRLQGFPDWWEDGVEGSDSAKYKMWGNGIALPCAVDVLRRIAKEMEDTNGHQTD